MKVAGSSCDRIARGLATLLLLLAAGCGEEKNAAKPPRPVRVQVVAAAQALPPLRFSGSIEPARQVSLSFEMAGTLTELARVPGADGHSRGIEAGDRVKAGQLLARLDPLPAEQRFGMTAAQLEEAKVMAAKAEQDRRRAEALFAARATTLPELEGARAAAAAAAQRVAAATAQAALARDAVGDTRLTAPFAATVLRRRAEIGALAAPGVPLFELADTGLLKVVFGVPDTVVGRLRPGQELPLFAQVLAGSAFKGRVSTVSPSADPQSRVFAVEVEIPNPDDRLKIGMIVSVEVPSDAVAEEAAAAELAARAPVLVSGPLPAVALAAVVRAQKAEGYAVFVLAAEGAGLVARERSVQVGEIFGNEVSLSSGVALGEKVVVAGASLLADGDAVVVIP